MVVRNKGSFESAFKKHDQANEHHQINKPLDEVLGEVVIEVSFVAHERFRK